MKYLKVMLIICSFILLFQYAPVAAFTDQELVISSFGDDVIELQAILQYLGYYHGSIDGHYGHGTSQEVKQFQKKFGISVDGIAGSCTKKN